MVKKIFLANNLRSIRAQTKTVPLAQLQAIVDKLTQIVSERQAEEQQAQQNLIEHNKKVEDYLAQIKRDGVAVNELLQKANPPAFKKLRKSRPPRPPKYKYVDEHGNLRTWTGQGRMPKPIQQTLCKDSHRQLSDFLIEPTKI